MVNPPCFHLFSTMISWSFPSVTYSPAIFPAFPSRFPHGWTSHGTPYGTPWDPTDAQRPKARWPWSGWPCWCWTRRIGCWSAASRSRWGALEGSQADAMGRDGMGWDLPMINPIYDQSIQFCQWENIQFFANDDKMMIKLINGKMIKCQWWEIHIWIICQFCGVGVYMDDGKMMDDENMMMLLKDDGKMIKWCRYLIYDAEWMNDPAFCSILFSGRWDETMITWWDDVTIVMMGWDELLLIIHYDVTMRDVTMIVYDEDLLL